MKKFQIRNIQDLPLEGTHDLPNSRQTLATKEDIHTDNIDALTKGYLQPGEMLDWHQHSEHDELGIVLKGTGEFHCENEMVKYNPEDVIIIPSGSQHKFVARTESEFYFVRIKV